MSAESPLRVDHHGNGVAVVTLALPERRNAMTTEVTAAWQRAMEDLRGDPELRCVVVTGEGSAFCAGGDLTWIVGDPGSTVDAHRRRMLTFYRAWLSVQELEVPVLAAVNGPAIGAGLCLALACDLRYGSDAAAFSVPFAALGMHPGMAATWLLPQAVGLTRARELLFTGRQVHATEAAAIGLLHDVLPADQLLERVLEIAAGIARQAPIAIRLTKAALARGGHATLHDALEWEALAQPITLDTEDLREGVSAARERRAPHFQGR